MELVFPWPTTNAEWMAWSVAAFTLLLGLVMLFAPAIALRVMRLQTAPQHPEALAEIRGRMAGFYLGLSLCCILLAQPLIYVTLGFAWLFTAFGRLISMLSDAGLTPINIAWLIVELALSLTAIAYGVGWLA